MNKACEAATVKKTKSLGNYQQTLKAHNTEHKRVTMPSKDIILHNQVKSVEVTVKTKGQKRTSPVASFSPGQKAEKKRSTTNNTSPQNWGNVFRQQNLLHMTKEQTSTKHSEDRESKKNINAKTQQKSTVKHPMRSEEKHLETCCLTTLVRDSSVQCTPYNAEIYNPNNVVESNSAHMFNNLHMFGLIKQLQDLVNKKDKKTCESIVTEMEQILQKISDLTKVESSAVSLKESSKKMKAMYDSVIVERDKLQSEILQQNKQLKEIEFKVKVLTLQLDTATREKNDMISVVADLRRQTENNEKIIKDLKMDLNKKQTELAQNYIDSKFEIDKLSALSSYKDTLITGYRSTITELQNQITSQLKILNEICMKEGSSSPQMSFIHTGHACSSPTSTDDSNRSLHDLSDVSTVNSIPEVHARRKDALVGDSELVSLLDGESSHTLLSDRNEVTNDKRSAMRNNNENNTVPYQNVDTNNVKKSLRHSCNKENDIYKTRKFKKPTEKQNDKEQFRKLFLNASKALESIRCAKSTVSGIRKQGDMQNRKPVNIPSPLRDCPHPDWSDSSLPSISTVSNLDMVPSNDI